MPRVSRVSRRRYAQDLREVGQLVTFLIDPVDSNTSTDTPLDPTISNEAIDVSTAQKVNLYAKVAWHKLNDIKYQESGKTIFREASVTTSVHVMAILQKCFAIQMSDGSILRKDSENLSETATEYTIVCSGYMRVNQEA